MFCCGVVQAAAMAEAKAAAKAAEEAAAKAQVAREKVSCTCVGRVLRLWPAQLLLLLLLLCHGVLILSCCDVPLSRCLCAVMPSRKMFISVHVACCFAHAAFVMAQCRIFLNCLL